MRSLLSIISLCMVVLMNAQYDPTAKKHLDKLSMKLKSYDSFKSNFLYHLDGPSDLDESYEGSIAVKGTKFHLKTNVGMEIICDGTNICNYNVDDEEVLLYEFDESEDGIMTPTKVAEMYKDGYRYQMSASDDPTTYLVELIPDVSAAERDRQAVIKIKLYIKKSDGMLKKWHILERTGNKYTITIKDFSPNVAVASNEFMCSPSNFPADVDFNDLR